MIFRVKHSTRYSYAAPVDLAAHLLHLLPRSLPYQRVVSAQLQVTPKAGRRRDGVDHFGNLASWLFLDLPHPVFEVTTEAVVDVCLPPPPAVAATLPWEQVAVLARLGGPGAWQAAEFAFGSPMVAAHADAGAYAAQSFPPGRPVLAGLLELNARIRADFRFRAGVTSISTPISEVLERREGVCQDFTHLMIGALRWLGLPAWFR